MKTTTDHRHKASRFQVQIAIEFIKDLEFIALDEEEAREIAENRAYLRAKTLSNAGYSIGDVEVLNIKEVRRGR